jgi:hypothetical protein
MVFENVGKGAQEIVLAKFFEPFLEISGERRS